jgi:hypothetical protein
MRRLIGVLASGVISSVHIIGRFKRNKAIITIFRPATSYCEIARLGKNPVITVFTIFKAIYDMQGFLGDFQAHF